MWGLKLLIEMGGSTSKASGVVKADGDFTQESLRDQSWSPINLHLPSSFGGALAVVLVLGLAISGFALAEYRRKRKAAARRAVTSLELKCPA